MSRRTIRTLLLIGAAFAALLAFAPGALAHSWKGDRNHDRIPDRWEKAHHLSLKVNQAKRDQDRDGLRNRAEFMAGDDPRDADSDNDGTDDGDEKAGTVTSFTGGVLIVHLFHGEDVKGAVDSDTEIECEDAPSTTAATGDDDHGDDDEGDDDDQGQSCDASKLLPGAVVKEAEVKATAAGLVFEQIELIG